ncbi:MAG: anthrone oxygenase family protein [Pseudomonadota bacterium]
MSSWLTIATLVAIIGCGIVGGIFFAFSNFVMQALASRPSAEGLLAMQRINITVLNVGFLSVFMGTAIVSVIVAVAAITGWDATTSPFLLGGALAYVVGTWLVTGVGNVPLNNQLALVTPSDPEADALWTRYVSQWTKLNTLRTAAAVLAMMLFTLGLLQP